MTRTELSRTIRRHALYRDSILWIIAAAVFGTAVVNILFGIPPGILISIFFGVPALGFICGFFVLRRFRARCPYCGGYLGLEKKRFYDVTKTGRCRACGTEVIDDPA
jgi:hypothetical protein